ncbi:MAG TPA: 50S ribosomal protein L10 [archaeon]|nr:50S ribosomal protein L10 [archaeon]
MGKEQNTKAVEQLKEQFAKSSILGFIDLYKSPSKQMQEIKKKLGGRANIKVVKKSVLIHTMNKFENLKPLIADLPSQPALMFTEEDPFKIYLTISNLKSDTYAKDGDIVDTEILVTAGPTSLLPGPVISEFAKVKIPAGVEAGKIAVKKDTVVAKAGDKVSKDLANILRKLNIKPMKVKMNVYGIFDGENLFKKEVLELVGDNFLNKVKQGFSHALSLTVSIGYPTKENIGHLLAKAHNAAKLIESKVSGGAS